MMNWDHIRYFIEVAKAGSVIKAAGALGVSHATVIRAITRLEHNLGTTLFDRLQSGYQITAQGEDLLAHAVTMQEQAQLLARSAAGKNPTPEGLLRLDVPDSSLFDVISLVAPFRKRFPLITIEAQPGAHDATARFNADVAFVITNKPPEDLVGRQLSKIELAYYASPSYMEGQCPDALKPDAFTWITWGSEASDTELGTARQESLLRRFAKQPHVVLHTASHQDALSAARSGVGAGWFKKPQPDLIELPLKSTAPPFGIWMLTHQDLRRSGRTQAFMHFVADCFS